MSTFSFKIVDADDRRVTLYETDDPATNAPLVALKKALASEGQDQLRVEIAGSGGDIASETTLSSLLTELQGTVDVSIAGDMATETTLSQLLTTLQGTVTVDAGDTATEATLSGLDTKVGEVQETPTAFTLLDRLAQIEKGVDLLRSEFADQMSYSDVIPITFDQILDPQPLGFEVLAGGSVTLVTDAGNERTIPVSAGRVYPLEVRQFNSTSSISASDILAYT